MTRTTRACSTPRPASRSRRASTCLASAIQTPFPGTPLYKRLEREGRITTRDWSLYDGQHVVFEPRNISQETLQTGHERAWRTAYSARAIATRLARSRTQLPISIMANMGYRYYARHLHTHYTCDWAIGHEPAREREAA